MAQTHSKVRVVFAVDPATRDHGSTLMRSDHLGDLLKVELGNFFSYSISDFPRSRGQRLLWILKQPRGSVIVFTKWTIRHLSQKVLDFLHAKGHITCLDYVDLDLRKSLRLTPTFHIAASMKALKVLTEIHSEGGTSARIALLHHPADSRLLRMAKNDMLPGASVVYVGQPSNAFWSNQISEVVTMMDVNTGAQMENCIPLLKNFNVHYCVRRRQTEDEGCVAKPFTKGFTAAYCSSVVISSQSEFDAVDLLGSDYPYFVRNEEDEKEVLDCLERISKGFKSREWEYAYECVQSLKAICSPRAISQQFSEIIRGT